MVTGIISYPSWSHEGNGGCQGRGSPLDLPLEVISAVPHSVVLRSFWHREDRTFYSLKVKENINKTKRQPSEWDKIFANEATDKGLISKIYKQVI